MGVRAFVHLTHRLGGLRKDTRTRLYLKKWRRLRGSGENMGRGEASTVGGRRSPVCGRTGGPRVTDLHVLA